MWADDIIRLSAPAKKERQTESYIGVEIELLGRFLCRSADVSRRVEDETSRLGPLDGADGPGQVKNREPLPSRPITARRARRPASGRYGRLRVTSVSFRAL